jgi:hypothetical protein
MARFCGDKDFPFGAVLILRQLGHDVLTVSEAGRCGGDDPDVLADAAADGRAVLTHNHNHFRRLHRTGRPHARIISCTRDDRDLRALPGAFMTPRSPQRRLPTNGSASSAPIRRPNPEGATPGPFRNAA